MAREETVFGPGEIIADRYEIVEELGRGAYGVVFRAIQLGIGRPVAVKTLLPRTAVDTEEQQRFEREAVLISRLAHPHIITLFDFGEDRGVLYMVMEFLQGRTLGERIEAEGAMKPGEARDLVYQMLDALQYAHDQGVVHRDLKPENIWLLPTRAMDGSALETLKILDFGIGKFLHGGGEPSSSVMDGLTEGGIALGTPQYMSPENISGDPVTHHADLYSVGLLLYEMLLGEPAFSGKSAREVMVAHLRDDPPSLPEGEEYEPFRRAVEWALVKQPDERAPSARALREILEEDGPAAIVQEVAPAVGPGPQSSLMAVFFALALVAILLFLVWLGDREEPEPRVVVREVPVMMEESREAGPGASEEEEEVPLDEEEEGDGSGGGRGQQDRQDVAEAEVEVVRERREPRRPPAAGRVTLEITTTPADARVSVDGVPLGTAPLRHEVEQGEEPMILGFSLIGYRDTVVTVVPDEDRRVEVRLERGRLELVP